MKTLIQVSHTEYGHTFKSNVYFDGQVYRWSTNDAVPPADAISSYGIDKLPGFNQAAHTSARNADTSRFLAEYRQEREKHGYSSEELYEMRAAFGPGKTVVDVVTGKQIKL
jgi:hypothetical protein